MSKPFQNDRNNLKLSTKFLFYITIVIGLMGFFGCNTSSEKEDPFSFFEQIKGTWQNTSQKQFERWYIEKGVPKASSFKLINNKDTVVMERIKIIKENEDLYFVVTLLNHKNDPPVRFKKIEETENSITFENKDHDFPQKIVYELSSPNSLKATISGEIDGKTESVLFPFTRLK